MAKKILSIRVEDKTTLIVHMDYGTAVPNIYGCMRVPTPQGAVNDGTIEDVTTLTRLIKKACNDRNIHTRDVIFTIASNKIANREVTIPIVAKSKIQQLVEAKASEYFPVDVSNYTFSFSSQGRNRDTTNNTMDLLVFAAPNTLVESYYTLADALDFNIISLDAVGNSVFQLMRRQVKNGVIMSIQVDRTNTLINIMGKEQLLLQRSVSYGIGSVTDGMMEEPAFRVNNYEDAFQLLTTQQVLLPSFERISEEEDKSKAKRSEITETLQPLISNVGRIIEYYNSKYKENPITEILCTGVGASAVGIQELFTKELGIQTSIPSNLNGIKFTKKGLLTRTMLQYAGCFGATIAPVKFVPKNEIARVDAKSKNFGSYLILSVSIFVCLVMSGVSILMLLSAKSIETAALTKVNAIKPVQQRYTSLMKKESDYSKYEMLRTFAETSNNELKDLIGDFNKNLPTNAKVSSMVTTTSDITLNVAVTDKLSAVSALIDKLQSLNKTNNVEIGAISKGKDSLTKRAQYVFTVTFNFSTETAKAAEETTSAQKTTNK